MILLILGSVAFFSGFIFSKDRQMTVEGLEQTTYPPSAGAGLCGEVFEEQGLPNGTIWSITITSSSNNTSITHESNNFLIVFYLPITSTPYTWHLNPVRGYISDFSGASFLTGVGNSTFFGYNNVGVLWTIQFYSNSSINNYTNMQMYILSAVMIFLASVVVGTLILVHFGYRNEYSRKRDS
jgi:hypothetical protein